MKKTTFVLLLAFLATPGVAQKLRLPSSERNAALTPRSRHVTYRLFNQPSGRRALRRYQRAREAGRLPSVQKRAAPQYEVGDEHVFQVRNLDKGNYDAVTFTLQRIEERFYLWIANNQLDNVRERDIDSLNTALAKRTPVGSFNSQEGIIFNDETVFGTPPNVDGDGRSDILLVDIKDGYDPVENPSFVAGFTDPNDLTENGSGNHRDILYLDVFPGIFTRRNGNIQYQGARSASSTAAHEYQHLIHAHYDALEATFVNEGLSEFAEVVNGYVPRPPTYLSSPSKYNVPLTHWPSPSSSESTLDDYQRAGLFTYYLSKRLGVRGVGAVTRDDAGRPGDAVSAYQNVLQDNGLTFREVAYDFHTANFLNDPAVDSTLGYDLKGYEGVHAAPTRLVDGRTNDETKTKTITVKRGAVQYLVWNFVDNFRVNLRAQDADQRGNLKVRALLYRDETIDVRSLSLGEHRFSGEYDRVALAVTHLAPNTGNKAKVQYSAQWDVDQTYQRQVARHDDGTLYQPSDGSPAFFVLGGAELLTRFENPAPDDGFLSSVKLPLYFANQFQNTNISPDAPRDYTFIIRAVTPSGKPGNELFILTRDADPPTPQSDVLRFISLDLSDYEGQLGDLPKNLYIGYRNAGGDDNSIVFIGSPYEQEDLSYAGLPGQWTPLWDLTFSGKTPLDGAVVPFRATFLVPDRPPSVTLAEEALQVGRGRTAEAAESKEGVRLTWTTTAENNLNRIVVERSTNGGQTYQPIDTVRAKGGDHYSVTDNLFNVDHDTGQLTYRLRYLSSVGITAYSDPAAIEFGQFALHGNSSNPFRQRTKILYELPSAQDVTLTVYNALGRRVRTLINGEQRPGGLNAAVFEPNGLSAGAYFYVLQAGGRRRTGEMVYVR